MEIISRYTRADAIADGELIDVSEMAKEAGFKFPVALTRAVYQGYVVPSPEDIANGQDKEGRLWDTLWMLYVAIKSSNNGSRVDYKVIYRMNEKNKTATLKALVHPGDQAEPVITILLPEED